MKMAPPDPTAPFCLWDSFVMLLSASSSSKSVSLWRLSVLLKTWSRMLLLTCLPATCGFMSFSHFGGIKANRPCWCLRSHLSWPYSSHQITFLSVLLQTLLLKPLMATGLPLTPCGHGPRGSLCLDVLFCPYTFCRILCVLVSPLWVAVLWWGYTIPSPWPLESFYKAYLIF